ncbi:hypothetical protein DAEQUDRAFT_705813 [Daedalea quercina L-15889]|uniref:E3 ubiquitin protein ligase n=1 Tax=Daedalea quercina L-15889 TaxID=1314783 RepID=A0A165SKE6_9APHY|nr:hypothetical protein DAEQUDRAFT_705813 [Daedalea quercina L-15889]
MAETKKRPHADDAEQSLPKKRAVSEEKLSASPANGVASHTDEPRDGDNLEMFRKDAIYRRMKYYSREYERSEARVAELERRRSSCEAGLAALEACWTQIIGTIRMLVKHDDLPPVDVKPEELYDLTARVSDDADPQYLASLRGKMQATTELVSAFVRLGGHTQVKVMQDEDYRMRQKAQTEESSLRAELSLTRTRLRDITAERDEYREQLVIVEKRLDRLRSEVVKTSQGHSLNGQVKNEPPPDISASPAPPPVEENAGGAGSLQEWEAIAKYQSNALAGVRSDNVQLRQRIAQFEAQIAAGTEEVITASVFYRMLKDQIERLESARQEDQETIDKLGVKINELEETHKQLATVATVASAQDIAELKAMLTKRDHENARLREQRDQQAAELLERKQKEQVKWQALDEYKQLSESRSERIELLRSEVMRLKSRLAAQSGDKDILWFVLRDDSEGSRSYVDDLKDRLRAAEDRVAALEVTFFEQQSDRGEDLRAEADARIRLAAAERQLEKYRSLYGDASALPSDAASLLGRLEQKEHDFECLTLQLKQQQEAESTIYAELDKLSAAWESLDKHLQSKAFDLAVIEEKLAKSVADKARSDNKYYAAMRSKEASDSERKQLSREYEKQAKVIVARAETEEKLTAHLSAAEKELNKLRAACAHWEKIDRMRKADLEAIPSRMQAQKQAYDKAASVLREQLEVLSRERAQLLSAEEAAWKAKKEAERQAAKYKLTSQNANSSTREAQLQKEVDQCMSILKCSTCKQNMRNTVITKCMHSFCKSCVETRIQTRQRKCPACNLPFSQGEVQTLFFQ